MRRFGRASIAAAMVGGCVALGGAAVGAHQDAAAVFTLQTTPALRAVGGFLQAIATLSSVDAWSVGSTIAHFNGSSWSTAAAVTGGGTLGDVSGDAGNDVWAAGTLGSAALVEHWNGSTWTQVKTAPVSAQSTAFNSILALTPSDVWAAGEAVTATRIAPLFEQWNGTNWTVAHSPAVSGFIEKLAGTGPNDIWAVGYTTSNPAKPLIIHFNGSDWLTIAAPFAGIGGELYGVVALSANNAWAVGYSLLPAVGSAQQDRASPVQTLIEHWDGQSWQVVPSPNIGTPSVYQRNALYGINALSPNDLWAAGQFQLPDGSGHQLSLALHWDGSAWSIAPTVNVGLAGGLRGVGVAPPSTVFLVGSGEFGGGGPVLAPLIAVTPGG
jgi:hypothetical protein